MKRYINSTTHEQTTSAAVAMSWHRAGHGITVLDCSTYRSTHIEGAAVKTSQQKTDDENRAHCRRIAEDVEAWASGQMYRCPDCRDEFLLPDTVGDKYKCPSCGTVHDVDDLEELSLWDYMEDIWDIQYLIESDRKTVRSAKILVAFGGPNIYINTDTRNVELYWWTDRASYPLSDTVCDEIDGWAQEMFDLG